MADPTEAAFRAGAEGEELQPCPTCGALLAPGATYDAHRDGHRPTVPEPTDGPDWAQWQIVQDAVSEAKRVVLFTVRPKSDREGETVDAVHSALERAEGHMRDLSEWWRGTA
jgi:hypothetical protein